MSVPTVSLASILGVNNRLPPDKLRMNSAEASGVFVTAAANVDITDAGTLQRRKGADKVVSGGECHSFWSDYSDDAAFYVDYDKLYRVTSSFSPTVLASVTPGLGFSYCKTPLDIYASNGVQFFRISSSGVISPAVIPLPCKNPSVTVQSTQGSIPSGRYQLAVSHELPSGEEGGTSTPIVIEVSSDTSRIELQDIPLLDGYATTVYMTGTNGDQFYAAATVSSSTLTFSALSDQKSRPVGFLLAPTPAGNIVRLLNGRLLVASGNFLFYSEPYAYSLYNPAQNYIPFPEPITMVEPRQNGFYLSADQTYWIDGDLPRADLNPVLPYRAIYGTSGVIPNTNDVWWMSERGMVVASQDGQALNLQEKNVAVAPAVSGASLFREQDGLKQMISTLFGPQSTVMAASSFMDAEVIRKETVL